MSSETPGVSVVGMSCEKTLSVRSISDEITIYEIMSPPIGSSPLLSKSTLKPVNFEIELLKTNSSSPSRLSNIPTNNNNSSQHINNSQNNMLTIEPIRLSSQSQGIIGSSSSNHHSPALRTDHQILLIPSKPELTVTVVGSPIKNITPKIGQELDRPLTFTTNEHLSVNEPNVQKEILETNTDKVSLGDKPATTHDTDEDDGSKHRRKRRKKDTTTATITTMYRTRTVTKASLALAQTEKASSDNISRSKRLGSSSPVVPVSRSRTMEEVLSSIPGFGSARPRHAKRHNRKLSTAEQLELTKEGCIDLETPSSVLTHVKAIHHILNQETFYTLPPLYQFKLAQLLPDVDTLLNQQTGNINISSLHNEFYSKALEEWKTKLMAGDFTPEQRQKYRQEAEKEKLKLDPWKIKHFEPIWGEKRVLCVPGSVQGAKREVIVEKTCTVTRESSPILPSTSKSTRLLLPSPPTSIISPRNLPVRTSPRLSPNTSPNIPIPIPIPIPKPTPIPPILHPPLQSALQEEEDEEDEKKGEDDDEDYVAEESSTEDESDSEEVLEEGTKRLGKRDSGHLDNTTQSNITSSIPQKRIRIPSSTPTQGITQAADDDVDLAEVEDIIGTGEEVLLIEDSICVGRIVRSPDSVADDDDDDSDFESIRVLDEEDNLLLCKSHEIPLLEVDNEVTIESTNLQDEESDIDNVDDMDTEEDENTEPNPNISEQESNITESQDKDTPKETSEGIEEIICTTEEEPNVSLVTEVETVETSDLNLVNVEEPEELKVEVLEPVIESEDPEQVKIEPETGEIKIEQVFDEESIKVVDEEQVEMKPFVPEPPTKQDEMELSQDVIPLVEEDVKPEFKLVECIEEQRTSVPMLQSLSKDLPISLLKANTFSSLTRPKMTLDTKFNSNLNSSGEMLRLTSSPLLTLNNQLNRTFTITLPPQSVSSELSEGIMTLHAGGGSESPCSIPVRVPSVPLPIKPHPGSPAAILLNPATPPPPNNVSPSPLIHKKSVRAKVKQVGDLSKVGGGSRTSSSVPPGSINLERSYQICQAVIQNSSNREQLQKQLVKPPPVLIPQQKLDTNPKFQQQTTTTQPTTHITSGMVEGHHQVLGVVRRSPTLVQPMGTMSQQHPKLIVVSSGGPTNQNNSGLPLLRPVQPQQHHHLVVSSSSGGGGASNFISQRLASMTTTHHHHHPSPSPTTSTIITQQQLNLLLSQRVPNQSTPYIQVTTSSSGGKRSPASIINTNNNITNGQVFLSSVRPNQIKINQRVNQLVQTGGGGETFPVRAQIVTSNGETLTIHRASTNSPPIRLPAQLRPYRLSTSRPGSPLLTQGQSSPVRLITSRDNFFVNATPSNTGGGSSSPGLPPSSLSPVSNLAEFISNQLAASNIRPISPLAYEGRCSSNGGSHSASPDNNPNHFLQHEEPNNIMLLSMESESSDLAESDKTYTTSSLNWQNTTTNKRRVVVPNSITTTQQIPALNKIRGETVNELVQLQVGSGQQHNRVENHENIHHRPQFIIVQTTGSNGLPQNLAVPASFVLGQGGGGTNTPPPNQTMLISNQASRTTIQPISFSTTNTIPAGNTSGTSGTSSHFHQIQIQPQHHSSQTIPHNNKHQYQDNSQQQQEQQQGLRLVYNSTTSTSGGSSSSSSSGLDHLNSNVQQQQSCFTTLQQQPEQHRSDYHQNQSQQCSTFPSLINSSLGGRQIQIQVSQAQNWNSFDQQATNSSGPTRIIRCVTTSQPGQHPVISIPDTTHHQQQHQHQSTTSSNGGILGHGEFELFTSLLVNGGGGGNNEVKSQIPTLVVNNPSTIAGNSRGGTTTNNTPTTTPPDHHRLIRNNCVCDLRAMLMCRKCGAFCHDDCMGPADICMTCMI